MSLAARLAEVSLKASMNFCKFGELLYGSKLSEKEKSQLEAILAVPDNSPARVSSAVLSSVLREEGHDVSSSSIDRHKNKSCSCNRKTN